MRLRLLLTFALTVVVNNAYTVRASKEVRVMDFTSYQTDKSYLSSDFADTRIIRVNETYNRLQLKVVVNKDLPRNTEFSAVIARSKTEDGPWQLIASYDLRLCNKFDKYHKYLPNFLIQLTEDGKCIKKGTYEFEDAGIFKFYDLLQEKDIDGYYFATINVIKIPSHQLSMSIVRSVSVNV